MQAFTAQPLLLLNKVLPAVGVPYDDQLPAHPEGIVKANSGLICLDACSSPIVFRTLVEGAGDDAHALQMRIVSTPMPAITIVNALYCKEQ